MAAREAAAYSTRSLALAELSVVSRLRSGKPNGSDFDLEHVTFLRLHAAAEGERRGPEEMNVDIARPPKQCIFEMMRLEIGDRMSHVLLAGQERLFPDHFLPPPDARYALDVGRQIANQQFRT